MAKSKKSKSSEGDGERNADTKKLKTKDSSNAMSSGPISLISEGSLKISLLVKPGAKESRVSDISEDYIGVQIAAPPRDGEANKEIVSFLAQVFQTRKTDISIMSGMKSREKVVRVDGGKDLSIEKIRESLESNMQQ
ncbi:1396_t:CDS:2 [Ambispora leptoticha]|uniref:1396_t:CDS:1 n=1 Tax=Ambispora leptoticha TaxID=144679 RepID=A0A9N8W4T0_9GLOM|nr:1396_t:CDS:2 [Ambispora leptoticha]